MSRATRGCRKVRMRKGRWVYRGSWGEEERQMSVQGQLGGGGKADECTGAAEGRRKGRWVYRGSWGEEERQMSVQGRRTCFCSPLQRPEPRTVTEPMSSRTSFPRPLQPISIKSMKLHHTMRPHHTTPHHTTPHHTTPHHTTPHHTKPKHHVHQTKPKHQYPLTKMSKHQCPAVVVQWSTC